MAKVYIGTSGWSYWHWKGRPARHRLSSQATAGGFYPYNLPARKFLSYFSEHFKTVEINSSFYHLPRPKTYENWASQVSDDFLFAVKTSRFITHIKRLKGVKLPWRKFLNNALHLGKKLGPILFQFPPSFRATETNIKRFEGFLEYISGGRTSRGGSTSKNLRFVFEFRHKTWFDPKIYKILRKYKVALVIADSSRYPKDIVATTDFVYFRYHGPRALFGSKYSRKQLGHEAKVMKKFLKQGRDIYIYFNNDFGGYAVENARDLIKILRRV